MLMPDKVERLDTKEIKSLLHARASGAGNVRKLGKLVDEVNSPKLGSCGT